MVSYIFTVSFPTDVALAPRHAAEPCVFVKLCVSIPSWHTIVDASPSWHTFVDDAS